MIYENFDGKKSYFQATLKEKSGMGFTSKIT